MKLVTAALLGAFLATAPAAAFAQPAGLAAVQQVLYVCDALGSAVRSLQLRTDLVQTLVGQGPWEFGDARWKHWLIQPEVRYWLCERFNGHFFGLHAHYAEYNAGGINFNADFHRNRYQGHLYGAGLSYGYQWLIGKRWNLEATVGLGYARLWDRKYPIAECGEVIRTRSRNYFGPTKIGLALIFIIK